MLPITENYKLKDMFIELSTNRDLRRILDYYDESNYPKTNIKADFEDIMENIETVEITKRLNTDLYVNFEGIVISNKDLDEVLVRNLNCKNVQLEYLAERTDFSALAIQIMINNNIAYPETIDLAIKNSTANLSSLESEKLCLLSKDSILKLIDCDRTNSNFIYLFLLKKELTEKEIDFGLELLKENNLKMDDYYAEALLEQCNLTEKQLQTIAFFDEDPSLITFSTCLEKDVYNEEQILKIYDLHKNDLEFINVLLNYKNLSITTLSNIYKNQLESVKELLENKANIDENFNEMLKKVITSTQIDNDIDCR